MTGDPSINPILTFAAVDPLDPEVISNSVEYTVTCRYRGTDNPFVTWIVSDSPVTDSDEGVSVSVEINEQSFIERYVRSLRKCYCFLAMCSSYFIIEVKSNTKWIMIVVSQCHRLDELTISGRSYSDAEKVISCKYSFLEPVGEITETTLLKFRGSFVVESYTVYH